MAINSSAPDYMDTLRTTLQARPALADVVVMTGPIHDSRGKDSLELIGIEADNNWGALGNKRIDEDYILTAVIWGYSRGPDDESAIKAARDAAFVIFDELLQVIRADPRLDATVRQSIPASYELEQGWTSEHRVARIDVEIHVTNQLRAQ